MFLLVPVKTDSPLRNTPWANWLLIALNLLMFMVQMTSLSDYSGWILNAQRPDIHQFISYAFLHDGFWHIAGNMLFLYIFGNNINDRLGNTAYLAFYLAAAAFAGIGYAALNPVGLVVGASGAVSAVTGAYLALLPRSRITLFYWLFILIGLYEVPSLLLILAFFLVDVYSSFSRDTGVAHGAHIAGSIFGFLISMLLLKIRLLPRDHFDMLSLLDRWNRRRQYQQVVQHGYDPFGHKSNPDGNSSVAANKLMNDIQDCRAEIAEALAHGNLPLAGKCYLRLQQLDSKQTLSRGLQLDIANYFYSIADYQNASLAYELFAKTYGTSEQIGHVALMLGLAYARHLNQPEKAKAYLQLAMQRLQFSREYQLAQEELLRLEQNLPPGK